MADEYFTLVFKGNLREFNGNPLRTETPFGIPFICALGNVCDEADELRERLETLTRDDVEAPLPFGDVGCPKP
jgi:hypothetical protein